MGNPWESNDPCVYVDLDDVLCETARHLAGELAKRHGRRVAFEDITSFDLGVSFGLGPPELERFMCRVHEDDVLLAMPPVAHAQEGLSLWQRRGCRICIMTGRPPSTADATRCWLRRHGFPCDSLTFVDKYGRPDMAARAQPALPLSALREARFALAVEDAPSMIEFFCESTSVPLAIFDRPWNASLAWTEQAWPRRVRRFRGWPALLAHIPDPAALDAAAGGAPP